MKQESPFNIKKALRIGFVVLIIGLFLAFFFLNIYSLPPRTPFDKWYRNWAAVVMALVVFLFFLFFLTRPRRPKEWHGAGLTTAFFISLFTEMFGEEFRRYRENAPGFVPIKGRIRWIMSILLLWMFGLAILPGIGGSQNLSVEETLAALGKGPTLGREMASVTIVEFSDFQCSFCKRFWADTLPKIKETYIQKGQVRLIYRHFAILGKNSLQAGQAAECAGEQGKFWEYHNKLFANQGKVLTDANLKGYAREVGLDASGFARCLSSNRYKDKVEGETAVAAFLGARGTPTFFINGRLLVGAQPFDVFQGVIEGQLKEAVSKKKK